MTNLRCIGNGSHAVMCLNGWFGHAGDWGPWEDYLDASTFTWVFPDYRGYGSRRTDTGTYTLEEITDDLSTLLERELASEYQTISLLGHSMGGVFAQSLIRHQADAIHSFIGISPVPASGSPMPEEQRALFESAENDVAARRMIIDITTGGRLSGRWLDTLANDTRTNSVDKAVAGYFHAWADCSFLEELGTQTIPALVIVGAHDPAVTQDSVTATYGTTFPNLQVITYPDAGHYAMYEAPVRLATDIENFLDRNVVNPE